MCYIFFTKESKQSYLDVNVKARHNIHNIFNSMKNRPKAFKKSFTKASQDFADFTF